MINNISVLAKQYVAWGKEFLTDQYGDYQGKTTGMDVEEDTRDEHYRNCLQNEILNDDNVSNCWWMVETYGHTLWIEF